MAIGIFLVVALIITQRWFWILGFFTAGLASAFTMLASIFYFQILAAVAFFFAAAVCWLIVRAIAAADHA